MDGLLTFLLFFMPMTFIVSFVAMIASKDEKVKKRAKILFVITFILLIIGVGTCLSNIGGGGMH